jgi:DNA-directed RNA polymerase sigma subunit (sigma70/sigma32)
MNRKLRLRGCRYRRFKRAVIPSGLDIIPENIPDPYENAEETLVEREWQMALGELLLRDIHEYFSRFSEARRSIYYQILETRIIEKSQTLQQIADSVGLSKERINQIQKKILERIKRFLTTSRQARQFKQDLETVGVFHV